MINTGIETVHTSAMVLSVCMSPPSLPFHTKSLSFFTSPSRIPSAARFPSLKTSAKRNRFSNQTANELNGLRIEDIDEDGPTEWEEEILRETAPLVGFMKMILQPGRYRCGDRLDPEHEKMILERILPYHPRFERKIGCGIDYITAPPGRAERNASPEAALDTRRISEYLIQSSVIYKSFPSHRDGLRSGNQDSLSMLAANLGTSPVALGKFLCNCYRPFHKIGYHPDFEKSRCLFVVQKDGKVADFSYWKCIKGLIRTKYSRHADSFIFKYFRWRERL